MHDAMIALPGLGQVHAVRLDNPTSEATLIYAGGNMSFVSGQSERAAALARATGADIILYDYPGRGGTDVPATMDASIAFGPSFMAALRAKGWIGSGPLFLYGFSFGGSQAAGMAQNAGAAGLIIEGSAADIAAVGRNFIPGLAKPFVRLRVDPDLARFDYLGYAVAARAPVLLIMSRDDSVVRPRNMTAFADQLRARGASVTTVTVPGGHGSALEQPAALGAIERFVATHGR
jgi:pimeloyl-ACP methyl ester carboxylesterase